MECCCSSPETRFSFAVLSRPDWASGATLSICTANFLFVSRQNAQMNVAARTINISTNGENCANKIYSMIPVRTTHFFGRTLLLATNKRHRACQVQMKRNVSEKYERESGGKLWKFGFSTFSDLSTLHSADLNRKRWRRKLHTTDDKQN